MGASKIVDETEIRNWIEAGHTYKWMAEQYQEKYNLEVNYTMFSNFRRRRGLDGRNVRDDILIPWEIKPDHRYAWAPHMLRLEARRRAKGDETLSEQEAAHLAGWKRTLEREHAVVHYDPDTEQGFFLVEPREGVDLDLIREPERSTTKRRSGS